MSQKSKITAKTSIQHQFYLHFFFIFILQLSTHLSNKSWKFVKFYLILIAKWKKIYCVESPTEIYFFQCKTWGINWQCTTYILHKEIITYRNKTAAVSKTNKIWYLTSYPTKEQGKIWYRVFKSSIGDLSVWLVDGNK